MIKKGFWEVSILLPLDLESSALPNELQNRLHIMFKSGSTALSKVKNGINKIDIDLPFNNIHQWITEATITVSIYITLDYSTYVIPSRSVGEHLAPSFHHGPQGVQNCCRPSPAAYYQSQPGYYPSIYGRQYSYGHGLIGHHRRKHDSPRHIARYGHRHF